MRNKEIAHAWANQTAETGSNGRGNLFFNENILYSYGGHFPLGILIGKKAYINCSSYSNTTAAHKGCALSAVNDFTHKVVFLDTDSMRAIVRDESEENCKRVEIAYRMETLHGLIADYKKPHKGLKSSRYSLCLEFINAIRELKGKKVLGHNPEKYALYQEWKNDHEDMKRRVAEQKDAREQARYKASRESDRKAYLKRDLQEGVVRSLKFKDPTGGKSYYGHEDEPVTLRVEGNRVKTSDDSEVHIKVAINLLELWKKTTGNKSFTDKEMKVNGKYQGVTIRRNGTVKIGCTRFLPDEVNNLFHRLILKGC